MISMGFAAFDPDNHSLLSTFEANVAELRWAGRDPDTMGQFWSRHPEAWKRATDNPLDPYVAMTRLRDWVRLQPKPWNFMAWPATYDYPFLLWYQYKFLRVPFFTSCYDLKVMASVRLNRPYDKCSSAKLPDGILKQELELSKASRGPSYLAHEALSDAIRQGWRYFLLDNLET